MKFEFKYLITNIHLIVMSNLSECITIGEEVQINYLKSLVLKIDTTDDIGEKCNLLSKFYKYILANDTMRYSKGRLLSRRYYEIWNNEYYSEFKSLMQDYHLKMVEYYKRYPEPKVY